MICMYWSIIYFVIIRPFSFYHATEDKLKILFTLLFYFIFCVFVKKLDICWRVISIYQLSFKILNVFNIVETLWFAKCLLQTFTNISMPCKLKNVLGVLALVLVVCLCTFHCINDKFVSVSFLKIKIKTKNKSSTFHMYQLWIVSFLVEIPSLVKKENQFWP